MANETNQVQFNPTLVIGFGIIGFDNGTPLRNSQVKWCFDPHTGKLFSFEGAELESLAYLQNKAATPTAVSELTARCPEWLITQLINHELLLTGSRQVTLSSPEEAEVWIQTNESCNLACAGCATGMDVQKTSRKFDAVTFEKCMRRVLEDANAKGFTNIKVKLGGGEPTLNGGQFVQHAAEILRQLSVELGVGSRLVLLSNGLTISDQLIAVSVVHGVHWSISVDPGRTVGKNDQPTYPRVLANIRKILDAEGSVSAQFTVSTLNAERASEVYEELCELRVPCHFSLFRPQTVEQLGQVEVEPIIQGMTRVYAQAYNRIQQNQYSGSLTSFDYLTIGGPRSETCGAGKTYVVLDSEGNLYSCHESIRKEGGPPNIFQTEENVFDLISWVHPAPEDQRSTQGNNLYPYFYQSGSGCPWTKQLLHGDYTGVVEYAMDIYTQLAPILLALLVLKQTLRPNPVSERSATMTSMDCADCACANPSTANLETDCACSAGSTASKSTIVQNVGETTFTSTLVLS